ncbi:MAG: SGNH/GDSL hydrolase family protein [Clostridiales bacterium]|nr:SGNH/GDSL hydrolase family protein [Clostridiales bacterium]
MKNVLLIGDSIRMGYENYVRDAFNGIAEIKAPEGNCRYALQVLRYAHEWRKYFTCTPEEVDIVHWNAGLWDVLRMYGDEPLTPVEFYANLIKRIDTRLRLLFPNAKIIFATSTFVQQEKYGEKLKRLNSDIIAYNNAALEVLKDTDTIINDLYAFTKDIPDSCRSDMTHFNTPDGVKAMGGKIVATLCKELGVDPSELAVPDAIPPEISAQVLGF